MDQEMVDWLKEDDAQEPGVYGDFHDIYAEKITMGRRCYYCGGKMRPTRKTCGGSQEAPLIRVFRCCDCGEEYPWLNDPDVDRVSANPFHKSKDGGYCCSSMMSDPHCSVFSDADKEQYHGKPPYTAKPKRVRTKRVRTKRVRTR